MNQLRSRQLEEVTEVEVDFSVPVPDFVPQNAIHALCVQEKGGLSLSAWLSALGPRGVTHTVLF